MNAAFAAAPSSDSAISMCGRQIAELPARALSGGNQQKLIIGREFELPPKLLLVSQPTRGVDIGAIEFIHRKLVALRDAGCAVLLVSAELEEVTALADRLMVIYDGRIVGEVDPARSNERRDRIDDDRGSVRCTGQSHEATSANFSSRSSRSSPRSLLAAFIVAGHRR